MPIEVTVNPRLVNRDLTLSTNYSLVPTSSVSGTIHQRVKHIVNT